MYSYFLRPDGSYYEGERQSNQDQEVPRRESPWDTFDGTEWIFGTPVPDSVTPLQARRALLAAGKLDAVNAAVAAGDQETRLAWEFSASVERNSQFVAALAAAIGLSDAEVDNLFRAAVDFV